MPVDRNALIESCLRLPPDAIQRGLSSAIAEDMPGRFIVQTYIVRDECKRFADKGHCRFAPMEGFRQEQSIAVFNAAPCYEDEATWYEIEWKGARLELLTIKLLEGDCRSRHSLLIASSQEVAEAFSVALEAFGNEVEGAVLVFAHDFWSFNEPLFNDIRNSTLDNLILPEGLSNTIRNDIAQWLESRELYEKHGIPWKRGMILIGPPGNGKTHMIKALANHFKVSTLYVREFGTRDPARSISEVFRRARSCTPSLLVLEDLDTLVTPKNRSYFLNEMDGFARNTGMLVVASANDPAKLDPALVNRPSRFDRRYVFGLPAQAERARYLAFFTSSLADSLQLSETDCGRISDQTEGFSYAYLKELVLSSMMAWISGGRIDPIAEVMLRELLTLREQMSSAPIESPIVPYVDPDDEED